uniref:Uracil phosphoribosyltransferase n=2 Tax=Acrobeloides nanus TaxID=290746 RepID=A0A914C9P3_9BILA
MPTSQDHVNGLQNGYSEMKQLVLLEQTDQVKELHTILRDKNTDHSEFLFTADRLMRLVIEEGLNRLPYTKCTVTTPTGCNYEGIKFARGNCGVSVCRSGEAMEGPLRQCCRSIRISKVLIGDDQQMLYARLMPDISRRRVLLLYPILSTGSTVIKAASILLENSVEEENIFLVSVFSTPQSIAQIHSQFPNITIITSEITCDIPFYFTTKYFGTD